MNRDINGRHGDDGSSAMDVTSVLTRLDAIVDRLEGVYERLIPMIEAKNLERESGRSDSNDDKATNHALER